ncbi:hypothetical protein BDQ12DRAFT_680744 [Crucibulum laeve]|uniref:F-box domain-containing protein n=1 Tax=Crucibulum laeve TaxID=68775 RepID=A0A5C3M4V1_9AGAR|nr:hypothetical protein BDQ12DRAFT_680744 [Crucibulum laeve]
MEWVPSPRPIKYSTPSPPTTPARQFSPHITPITPSPFDPAELHLAMQELTPLPKSAIASSAPIARLPYELLVEIFIHCLPKHPFIIPSRVQAPLVLTQICREWRTIALSTPTLWSSLHINYHDRSKDIPSTILWLSRSGDRPLSISLSIDFNEQRHQGILDVLSAHSHRWQHVRFDFRHLLCPRKYHLTRAAHRTPQLRTFEFHAQDISNTNITPITKLLNAAPGLREVSWVDDLADTDTMLELPLSRLTRLSLAMDRGTLDYLELLDQCSNLEHIRITRPCVDALPPRPPLLLSKLTSLNISHDLTGILDHLVLPALKHVRIHAEHERQHRSYYGATPATAEAWSPAPFLSLVERSACAVESLCVNAPMGEQDLVECVRSTADSLTRLSVMGVEVSDVFVGLLTYPEQDSLSFGLCTSLEELTLDTRITCASGVLTRMVESRLSIPSGEFREDTRKQLQKLRVLDGHKDMRRLRELGAEKMLNVDVIPRKEVKMRPKMLYRRKVCPSR